MSIADVKAAWNAAAPDHPCISVTMPAHRDEQGQEQQVLIFNCIGPDGNSFVFTTDAFHPGNDPNVEATAAATACVAAYNQQKDAK